MKIGEFVVLGDFAENFSFIIQDAVQSYHWTNAQATIHPFVVYYKNSENKLEHISFVILSEVMEHNTISVHLFQRKLIAFLRDTLKLTDVKKIYYCSDGAASQYKNRKNFINLSHHVDDFQCEAEWHFFATSHGKGPCDGIGGTLKRLARRASLQRPIDNQITNPLELYEWAKCNLGNIHVEYCTPEEYNAEAQLLNERFSKAVTIKGT